MRISRLAAVIRRVIRFQAIDMRNHSIGPEADLLQSALSYRFLYGEIV